jgi:hypothetical protein
VAVEEKPSTQTGYEFVIKVKKDVFQARIKVKEDGENVRSVASCWRCPVPSPLRLRLRSIGRST